MRLKSCVEKSREKKILQIQKPKVVGVFCKTIAKYEMHLEFSIKQFGYLLVYIFVVVPNTAESNNTTIGQPHISLVDQLIKDYLMAEENLWSAIERREPSTLQQIYDIHTAFLQRHYGESNVILNGIFIRNDPKLTSSIITINETSHDIAREFFEHRNYTVLSMKAYEGINVDKTFNTVFELTVNSTDFWSSLKNVSVSKVDSLMKYNIFRIFHFI